MFFKYKFVEELKPSPLVQCVRDSVLPVRNQLYVLIFAEKDTNFEINKAIENGASKIICEKDLDINIPYEKVENTTEYEKEYKKEILASVSPFRTENNFNCYWNNCGCSFNTCIFYVIYIL